MGRPKTYLSNAARQRAYRLRSNRRARGIIHQADEWTTPPDVFAALNAEFGFTLDVAADAHNAKCRRYFTSAEDGLRQSWTGVCFMNPPYGRAIGHWVQKARESAAEGATVVCLLPASVDTAWWHEHIEPYAEYRFLRGRLRFSGHGGAAPFPSTVVIFRPMESRRKSRPDSASRQRACRP
jgi:phage N-6-adenine-methyltransferase